MGIIKFTDYVPLNLTGVNSASKTLAAETVTGLPIATGALPGGSFYIGDKQAAQLSTPYYPVYAGWYRVVQVDTAAVVAKILFGTIGAQVTLAKGENVVTDASSVLSLGIAPCVFLTGGLGLLVSGVSVPALAGMTAGNYTIVQDAGDASVLVGANQTIAVGSILVSTTSGTVALSAAISLADFITFVGIAEAAVTTPAALTGTAVAAASGGVANYTGTYTGGAANAFLGFQFVITGASNAANNGTFICTASTATVLTLANPNAVAETHAHTATAQALVRARLGFPFGQNL